MSNPWLPKYGQDLLAPGKRLTEATWYRFFRDMWLATGFASENRTYSDIVVAGAALDDPLDALSRETLGTNTVAVGYPWDTERYADFTFRLPLNWRPSSTVTAFVQWAPTDATAGNVVWQLEYDVANVDSVVATGATLTSTSAAPAVSGESTRADFSATVGNAALVAGSAIPCRLTRLTDDAADTYANTAAVIAVVLRCQVQGIGAALAAP